MDPKKLLEQVGIIERLMAYCRYSKAEKLLRAIHFYETSQRAQTLCQIIYDASNEAKGHQILDVLRSLAKIRKVIQKKRTRISRAAKSRRQGYHNTTPYRGL